jgi:NADH-quinone oxidoreductase subunit L
VENLAIWTAFLPLLAAIMVGIQFKRISNRAAHVITTGAVMLSAVGSWILFIQIGVNGHEALKVSLLTWIHSGDLQADWALRIRSAI